MWSGSFYLWLFIGEGLYWASYVDCGLGGLTGLSMPLMALAGLAALSGFMAKELIILMGLSSAVSWLVGASLIIGAIATIGYSWRLILALSIKFSGWHISNSLSLFNLSSGWLLGVVSVANFTDLTWLELWWTVLPGVILVAIAYPSLRLLYLMDEVESPLLTLSVLGHQWYWEYALPELGVSFESYWQ